MGDPFENEANDPFSDPSVKNATIASHALAEFNPFEGSVGSTGDKSKSPKKEPKSPKRDVKTNTSVSASVNVYGNPAQSGAGPAAYNKLTEDDLVIREQNLLRREQKVLEREQQVDKRASQLNKMGAPPNWPSACYPLAYHDIQAEIPARYRPLVRKMYLCVLFAWICLFWNWIVMISVWFGDSSEGSVAFWSSVYFLMGVPGAWKFWYRSFYYAIRDNSNRYWIFFFFFFLCHIGFSIIMGVGVPSTSGAGIIFMLKLFTNSKNVLGICCLVSSACWGLNLLICFWLLKTSYATWKSSGGSNQLVSDVTHVAVETQMNAIPSAANQGVDDENV